MRVPFLRSCFLAAVTLYAGTALAAEKKSTPTAPKSDENDPLNDINLQIAQLEAKLKAIEHIKLYANSVNLQELSGRDIEQTVAQFVKSTRKSSMPDSAGAQNKGSMNAERKNPPGALSKQKSAEQAKAAGQVSNENARQQSTILNQILGKSMTNLKTTDHVYTFVSTRSLRQDMMTSKTTAIVVAPTPSTSEEDRFEILTHEGHPLFEHKLVKQAGCVKTAKRELIKSNNQNDLFFAYLCESTDGKNTTSLGFYRFEARDDKETQLKRIAIGEIWVQDLGELGLTKKIKSVAFTRSMSSRLKVVVALEDSVVILNPKDGSIESQEELDETLANQDNMKVFSIQTGFGLMSGSKIVAMKLTSAGKIDETFKPCQSMLPLVDTIYEARNPSMLFGLSEANELILFQLITGQADCQALGRVPLTDGVENRSVFDSVKMFGPLIVARNIETASLHFYLSTQDDLTSMVRKAIPEPAIYRLPECATSSQAEDQPFLGMFMAADSQLMTIETCPGQILTIQSTLKASFGDDDSWTSFFLRHMMKIVFMVGLVGTGLYQYKKMTTKTYQKQAGVTKDSRGGVSNQQRQQSARGAQQRGRKPNQYPDDDDDDSEKQDSQDSDNDRMNLIKKNRLDAQMAPLRNATDDAFKSQKVELEMLQKQLAKMENKIGGGAGDMSKMMEQLQMIQKQSAQLGKLKGAQNGAGASGQRRGRAAHSQLVEGSDSDNDSGEGDGRTMIDTSSRGSNARRRR